MPTVGVVWRVLALGILVLGMAPGETRAEASRDAVAVLDEAIDVRKLGAHSTDERVCNADGRTVGGSSPCTYFDSRPAFVQALREAWGRRHSGGRVRVPGPCVYRLSGSIDVPDGVYLEGDGPRATTLLFEYDARTGPSRAAIRVTWGYHSAVRDLTIRHAAAIAPERFADNGSGVGILFPEDANNSMGGRSAQNAMVERVNIAHFQVGVQVEAKSTWLTFRDMVVSFCGVAFSVSNANFPEFVRVVADHNQASWLLRRTTKAQLHDCSAQVNFGRTAAAIVVESSADTAIDRVWMERNAQDGVVLRGGSRGTRISGSLVQGSGWNFDPRQGGGWGGQQPGVPGVGIRIEDASDTILDGEIFGKNFTGDVSVGADARGTVMIALRSLDDRLRTIDSAPDTTELGSATLKVRPRDYGVILLPGSSGERMQRPGTRALVSGEISGVHGGAREATDGFLRLSAGGGGEAGARTYIDLSGASLDPDMNRAIVLGVQGKERMRVDEAGLRPGGGVSGPLIISGKGAPRADAPTGSLYLRADGGRGASLYVKQLPGEGPDKWEAK